MYFDCQINNPDIILPLGQLNLKEVKRIANNTRFKWFDIGVELDIDLDILTVSVTSCSLEVPTSVHCLIYNQYPSLS